MYDNASAQHCTEDYVNVNFPIKEQGSGRDMEEAKYLPGAFGPDHIL